MQARKIQRLSLACGLAILSISGAAQAQSSVALGGRVDGGVQYANDGVLKVKQQSSGVYTASRLNFKGTEDMGDGLKAVFFMEHRFNEDTGAQQNAGKFWNAEVYVGLDSKNFGRITLGRQYTPAFWPFLFSDDTGPLRLHGYSALQSVQRSNFARVSAAAVPQFTSVTGNTIDSTATTAGGSKVYQIGIASAFEDNMVIYKTPNMSGFTAMLGVGAGEGYGGGAAKILGANAEFRNSMMYLGAGYTSKKGGVGAGGALGEQKVQEMVFSGMFYATKDIHFWGNYHDWKFNSFKGAELKGHDAMIGFSYWLPAGEFWVNYASKTIKSCVSCNSKGFGVGYQHFMSKRTELYVGYGAITNQANSANTLNGISPNVIGADPKAFGAGIAHQF